MPQLEINNLYKELIKPEAAAVALFQRLEDSGEFPIGEGELSIAFVDDATIARIHGEFLGDPTPTDVITFPADSAMETAGEIVVSVDHARSRSEALGEPFSRELSLYLAHGWLHLAGYDDREASDRQAMRRAEQRALQCIEADRSTPQFRLILERNR
ncbi:MAG: rRNA maturation RNase YbeY [Verrucomicrobia bacterium]|jgi:probable rRNA maturation factor|nr:rRNA maturation RNase YbeY [Verrucomicrobiota bacterium]